MLLTAARLAFGHIFDPRARSVVLKSLALTLALLALVWFALTRGLDRWLAPMLTDWPMTGTVLDWLLGAGLLIGGVFLIGPVTAIFAGLFLDEVAETVEREHYPTETPGRPVPLIPSLWLSARFALTVALANLVALLLVLLPFVNFSIFFLVNAWLLGREYFTFAAMRFRPEGDAVVMRRARLGEVFLGGLMIAGFMAVPLLNLFTPVFAASLMVHLHKGLSGSRPGRLSGSRPGHLSGPGLARRPAAPPFGRDPR